MFPNHLTGKLPDMVLDRDGDDDTPERQKGNIILFKHNIFDLSRRMVCFPHFLLSNPRVLGHYILKLYSTVPDDTDSVNGTERVDLAGGGSCLAGRQNEKGNSTLFKHEIFVLSKTGVFETRKVDLEDAVKEWRI